MKNDIIQKKINENKITPVPMGFSPKLFISYPKEKARMGKIIDQKFICVHKSIKFFGLSFIFILAGFAFWLIRI